MEKSAGTDLTTTNKVQVFPAQVAGRTVPCYFFIQFASTTSSVKKMNVLIDTGCFQANFIARPIAEWLRRQAGGDEGEEQRVYDGCQCFTTCSALKDNITNRYAQLAAV